MFVNGQSVGLPGIPYDMPGHYSVARGMQGAGIDVASRYWDIASRLYPNVVSRTVGIVPCRLCTDASATSGLGDILVNASRRAIVLRYSGNSSNATIGIMVQYRYLRALRLSRIQGVRLLLPGFTRRRRMSTALDPID